MPRDQQLNNFNAVVPMRGRVRDRHGRGMRTAVTGPHLPPTTSRTETFFTVVAQTVQYLRSLWPQELNTLRVDVTSMPPAENAAQPLPRWHVDQEAKHITLYRIPIQRMSRLHVDDELHRRMAVEECVFRSVAELLGRGPWELGPERFHP